MFQLHFAQLLPQPYKQELARAETPLDNQIFVDILSDCKQKRQLHYIYINKRQLHYY